MTNENEMMRKIHLACLHVRQGRYEKAVAIIEPFYRSRYTICYWSASLCAFVLLLLEPLLEHHRLSRRELACQLLAWTSQVKIKHLKGKHKIRCITFLQSFANDSLHNRWDENVLKDKLQVTRWASKIEPGAAKTNEQLEATRIERQRKREARENEERTKDVKQLVMRFKENNEEKTGEMNAQMYDKNKELVEDSQDDSIEIDTFEHETACAEHRAHTPSQENGSNVFETFQLPIR